MQKLICDFKGNEGRVPACKNKLSFRRSEATEKSLISLKRFLPAVETSDLKGYDRLLTFAGSYWVKNQLFKEFSIV